MKNNYQVGNFYLDDNQMQLLYNDSNSLVIAGAGSGKTLTIIGYINYLIENNICSECDILVISFTNASVNDLKSKIKPNITIETFHKLAIRILDTAQVKYNICNDDYFLKYLVKEMLYTLDKNSQNIILKYLKYKQTYYHFLKSIEFESFCNLIISYINYYTVNTINNDLILKCNYKRLEKKVLLIIFNILYNYNSEKQSTNSLDFNDLIIKSKYYVKESNIKYKYIIIDEFQDTSLIRLQLIQELLKNNHKAKIIVVGDDWQSIYRFSGCDLNIFLNFQTFFKNVKTIYLKNTYRNSQELINIASKFIMKNKLQIQKSLFSSKSITNPIIFCPYQNKINTFKIIVDYLLSLSNDIMILSRNNNDILEYIDNNFQISKEHLTYKGQKIRYLTIHKSKGLEAKYVIVINCNDELCGLPNKIIDSPLLKKINSSNEIRYAEERRLFYVALTRCKEQVYLIYDKKHPSIFIKEIKKITPFNVISD